MSDVAQEPDPAPPRQQDDGSTAARLIRRYTNRKLYDNVERRYVTLQEIAALVRSGIELKIVDNYSMEDLTAATLSQIVFQEEKRNAQMPLGLLQRLLRGGRDAMEDFPSERASTPSVQAMLSTSQRAFAEWQRRIDERVRSAVEGAKGLTQLQAEFQRLHDRVDALDRKLDLLESRDVFCAPRSPAPGPSRLTGVVTGSGLPTNQKTH